MITIPIPTAGPKVTSLVWGSLDEKLITGHDNGDIVSWDVKEAQKDKIVSDHTKSITDMQLSADGMHCIPMLALCRLRRCGTA